MCQTNLVLVTLGALKVKGDHLLTVTAQQCKKMKKVEMETNLLNLLNYTDYQKGK